MSAGEERKSGILLHLSSLPSPYGIGDMGPEAYRFADFLHRAGQKLWQVLPLNPTNVRAGSSPYHSASLFAGNPLFLSPDFLARDGFIRGEDIPGAPGEGEGRVDYRLATEHREALLEKAFSVSGGHAREGYGEFCTLNSGWLHDHALFTALKKRYPGQAWNEWPTGICRRERAALKRVEDELAWEVEKEKFAQYLFFRQWADLRAYCGEKDIRIVGDIPIYPTFDSSDVWANGQYFKLDAAGVPEVVAGVPPDYFSETGQLWGNPVYDWETLEAFGFEWWRGRLQHNLRLYDLVRIDHFRGLVAFWEVPAGEKTAVNGAWVKVPSGELFRALLEGNGRKRLIAEDLGTITPDVTALRRSLGLPGMKVLLFAFGDDLENNPYLPHNYCENCVVYTGTHDNNTVRGWFEEEADTDTLERLRRYLGKDPKSGSVHLDLVRLATESKAAKVIIPMQDMLGLGAEARMNRPSVAEGNWAWRLPGGILTPELEAAIRDFAEAGGRAAGS
jgi:4-alpha-glucanotransferase